MLLPPPFRSPNMRKSMTSRNRLVRRVCILSTITFLIVLYVLFPTERQSQIIIGQPQTNTAVTRSISSSSKIKLDPHKTWKPMEHVRTEKQPKRGHLALAEQMAKPVICPPVTRVVALGNDQFTTVEQRLDAYFTNPQATTTTTTRAMEDALAACGGDVPMMAIEEYSLLFAMLRDTDAMLEWGSGKSSCLWSLAVGNLFSIEDSSTWVTALYELGLRMNQMIAWVPSYDEAAGPIRPPSSFEGYSDYIRYPQSIASTCLHANNAKFDVVLVDGRARPQCAWLALSLLREGGVLMIHDWEQAGRGHYRIVLRWFELLHVEHSLAIFKVKGGTAQEIYSNQKEIFPPWWYFDQDTRIWNTKMSDNSKGNIGVPFVEPFDVVDAHPSAEVMKPILKRWRGSSSPVN